LAHHRWVERSLSQCGCDLAEVPLEPAWSVDVEKARGAVLQGVREPMRSAGRDREQVTALELVRLVSTPGAQPSLEHVVDVPGAVVDVRWWPGERRRRGVLDEADRAESLLRVREEADPD